MVTIHYFIVDTSTGNRRGSHEPRADEFATAEGEPQPSNRRADINGKPIYSDKQLPKGHPMKRDGWDFNTS